MAWELAGTSFGRRADLYERFFANSYEVQKIRSYAAFDAADVVSMVRRMLRRSSAGAPFPMPPRFRAGS
jgi:aromatic ring hydroxylase